MNHWMWIASLAGILSTAVVWGTDSFFLTIGHSALRRASISAVTEVMGFHAHVRRRPDADLGRTGRRNPDVFLGVFGNPGDNAQGTTVPPGDLQEPPVLVPPQALVEADPEPACMILE